MATSIALGDPPIEISLRKNARARRLTLRIQSRDGTAVLTAPNHATRAQMLDFARRQEPWLREKLGALTPLMQPAPGMVFPFQGADMQLVSGKGRTARRNGAQIEVPGRPEQFASKLAAFLKVSARDVLAAAVTRYSEALNVTPGDMRLRDTRSRWGSCSSNGDLMFSWRLIMAPSDVLDYVAAHEVAHLIEMNHSQAYWSLVEKIYPGYRSRRDWLKREGSNLHRFQFKA